MTSVNTQLPEEYIKICLSKSEAPLNRKYLCYIANSEDNEAKDKQKSLSIESNNQESIQNVHNNKKRQRGMYKSTERTENRKYINNLQKSNFCVSLASIGECTKGEKCNYDHNIQSFLENKVISEEELSWKYQYGNICPRFENYGICNYGLNCIFWLQHWDKHLNRNIKKSGEVVTLYDIEVFRKNHELNYIDNEVRNQLLRKTVRFPKSDDFIKNWKESKYNPNISLFNKDKKQKNIIFKHGNPLLDQKHIGCTEKNKDIFFENTSSKTESSLSTNILKNLGCNDNKSNKEDTKSCSEVKQPCLITCNPGIDSDIFYESNVESQKPSFFDNKLILAPLTTLGNLPFRRLCVRLGADITFSEMTLCNEILAGKSSELALLRRHSEERCFGIQLAGGNFETIAKTGEFINEYCDYDFLDINVACPLKSLHDRGAGSILIDRPKLLESIITGLKKVIDKPLTIKLRMANSASPPNLKFYENTYINNPLNWDIIYSNMAAHKLIKPLVNYNINGIIIHGRTSSQRYNKSADWNYLRYCSKILKNEYLTYKDTNKNITYCPSLIGCGDVLNYCDYYKHLNEDDVNAVMIGRGALLKPWIFTEIKEQRIWDISAGERFEFLKQFVSFGLDHWGTDTVGIANTRRFLLELLSFYHRYIPVGLLEQPINSQNFNWRVPQYIGRNDLETLLSSNKVRDWIRLSEMLLGKVPSNFVFIPKHKSNSV
ncbi:dihydrouridine synthase family protein [Cryptosporidium muris RN66]|uniref:tRNA-dihydrouridine(47) synthase [NAD(P)(+)] n=1 Tax=Cryptosporidium muris (strain RN66) TaxID=441375 RepID=B6A9H7_CRYMR|nr:dihydrouridine synthase family protein [Cryptosporidium muris RN66]EEA04868.1 dihydrouridine synthase family protein [Cryptosporidium muris RN66]|eukprot:XP_002139217.1 dihydrouridine synthase family protein [Cryptosporidium muris RN66]